MSPVSVSTTLNELSGSCEGDKYSLLVELMADNASKLEHEVFIDSLRGSTWEERHRLHNFYSISLDAFSICLSEDSCHMLKMTDLESNLICCEHGNV